jgi:hypothetical protein
VGVYRFYADCYVIAYALTALTLRRYLEWQRGKLVPGWILLLLEVGLIAFASLLVAVVLALLRVPEDLLAFAFVFTPYAVFEALGMEVLYRHERWDVYVFNTILVLIWLGIVGSVTFTGGGARYGALHRHRKRVPHRLRPKQRRTSSERKLVAGDQWPVISG